MVYDILQEQQQYHILSKGPTPLPSTTFSEPKINTKFRSVKEKEKLKDKEKDKSPCEDPCYWAVGKNRSP